MTFDLNGNGYIGAAEIRFVLEAMKEPVTDEEIDEMMSQMFQVKTRISFDEDVKVKKMKHFKELEKNSFEYNSVEEGFSVSPILDVRLK